MTLQATIGGHTALQQQQQQLSKNFSENMQYLILWLNDMNMIAIDIIYHFFGHDI
jgi:hypothetical protein